MYKFGEEHPVLFEIILFVAAFAAAAVFTVLGSIFYLPSELSTSIARIAVGIALLLIYKRAFRGSRFFNNPVFVLPALLFPVWNIFYYLSSGIAIGGVSFFADGIITAMAPAIFEEVLFRGIFIYNLRKKGSSDLQCLLISAILFAAVHLTNLAGLSPASVAVQTVYSFVIGLVFAAVYLKNGSLFQVVIVHFLIDFTNRIFVEQPSHTSPFQMVIFGLLLAAEAIYAVRLIVGKPADSFFGT